MASVASTLIEGSTQVQTPQTPVPERASTIFQDTPQTPVIPIKIEDNTPEPEPSTNQAQHPTANRTIEAGAVTNAPTRVAATPYTQGAVNPPIDVATNPPAKAAINPPSKASDQANAIAAMESKIAGLAVTIEKEKTELRPLQKEVNAKNAEMKRLSAELEKLDAAVGITDGA